jgi:hypothetical protein
MRQYLVPVLHLAQTWSIAFSKPVRVYGSEHICHIEKNHKGSLVELRKEYIVFRICKQGALRRSNILHEMDFHVVIYPDVQVSMRVSEVSQSKQRRNHYKLYCLPVACNILILHACEILLQFPVIQPKRLQGLSYNCKPGRQLDAVLSFFPSMSPNII